MASNSGLEFSGGDLRVDLSGTTLTRSANGLSVTNPFTNTDESKLDGIASNAEVNVNSDWSSNSGDSQILNKPTIPDVSGFIDTAGNGLKKSGNSLAIDLTSSSGLEFSGGDLRVDLNGSSLSRGSSGMSVTNPFTDTDESKLDNIESNADVTDATNVRTALSGVTGDLNVNGQKITDLADPTNAQDAVTKTYVDSGRIDYDNPDFNAFVNVGVVNRTILVDANLIVPTTGVIKIFLGTGTSSQTRAGGTFMPEIPCGAIRDLAALAVTNTSLTATQYDASYIGFPFIHSGELAASATPLNFFIGRTSTNQLTVVFPVGAGDADPAPLKVWFY